MAPSPTGVLKCNVDASIVKDYPCVGIGIVVHNTNEAVVSHKMFSHAGTFSMLEAKAFGLLKAFELLLSSVVDAVIIELDAKSVVEAFSHPTNRTVLLLAAKISLP